MDMRSSIEDTRKGFEASFATGDFYNRQTQDSQHLEKILQFLQVSDGMRILDLGCGSGYLAFPMAKNNPDIEVIGLDIVSDTLRANRSRANKEGIKNLTFVSYDGIDFPFEDDSFDLVVTRYALHHFPDIGHSIGEMSRVLKEGGKLFISDPCPNECDTERFVDDYMRLKKDGHIKFYTKDEWKSLCGKCDLNYVDGFESSIRFPKKKNTAYGYEEVLAKHNKAVIESYDLTETDAELFITERVNNLLFRKNKMTGVLMNAEKAGTEDIEDLVKLRLSYLLEDHGSLDPQDHAAIKMELPGYFQAHLNKNLFVYVIRDGQNIVSCAFLLIVEKPMSPAFINGRTGMVLNVYTCPSYRRKGCAKRIMEELLSEAKKMEISVIELKATEDGYPLYRSVGFMEDDSEYHRMKWKNR